MARRRQTTPRKDGRHQRMVRDPRTGKRKAVYGKTVKECLEKAAALEMQFRQGTAVKRTRQTVAQYMAYWLEHGVDPELRPLSPETYERAVRLHIVPRIGGIRLQELTVTDVQELYDGLRSKEYSSGTIDVIHRVLGMALRQAGPEGWQLIVRDPTRGTKRPSVSRRKIVPMEATDIPRYLKAARGDQWECLWVLALTSGLRRGEFEALRWRHVDLAKKTLAVVENLTRPHGGWQIGPTKTPAGERILHLLDIEVAALRAHRQRQLEVRMAAGSQWKDNDLVFSTSVGSPITSKVTVKALREFLGRAKLGERPFHHLRHGAGTFMAMAGVDPSEAKRRLGHASEVMTLYYRQTTLYQQTESVRRMERFLEQLMENDVNSAVNDA